MSLEEYARMATLREVSLPALKEEAEHLPFVRSIDDILTTSWRRGAILFPNLQEHNETIQIFSDFGGGHQEAEYRTYSFLLCSRDVLAFYYKHLEELRRECGIWNPLKEISFKDLDHAGVRTALKDYLTLSNNGIVGLLITIIIDKSVKSVTGPNSDKNLTYVQTILNESGLGNWRPKVAEKVVFTVHVVSYLLSFLARNGQKLFWMTDNDEISANRGKHASLAALWQRVLNIYSDKKYSLVAYATPFEERDFHTMDLLSLPDLAAGAVEHFLTRRKKSKDPMFNEGALTVMRWLSVQGIALKKICIQIKSTKEGLAGSFVRIRTDDPGFLAELKEVTM